MRAKAPASGKFGRLLSLLRNARMSFSGRKNPSGIRPLLNVSLPLEATNLCNKHQASSRRFMSRLARFFEIAPGIRRAVHQPSCSFRHNSAAIPSKTLTVLSQRVCASAPGQANELAGIRLRRQAAQHACTPLRLASPINSTGFACTDTFKRPPACRPCPSIGAVLGKRQEGRERMALRVLQPPPHRV